MPPRSRIRKASSGGAPTDHEGRVQGHPTQSRTVASTEQLSTHASRASQQHEHVDPDPPATRTRKRKLLSGEPGDVSIEPEQSSAPTTELGAVPSRPKRARRLSAKAVAAGNDTEVLAVQNDREAADTTDDAEALNTTNDSNAKDSTNDALRQKIVTPARKRGSRKSSTLESKSASKSTSKVEDSLKNSTTENGNTAFDSEEEPEAGRSYFEANRGLVRTSNLTLASLNILPQEQLTAALKLFNDPLTKQQKEQCSTFEEKHATFELYLNAGHSLLVYGFGSKRTLLNKLADYLSDSSSVLVVNGFNPTLSLRSVFSQLASVLNLQDFSKRTLFDYVDAISTALPNSKDPISMIIHNIDGPALRQPECQHALSRLASCKNLHLVASIDHVNTPLLWDAPSFNAFSWFWVLCHTYLPYEFETHFSSKPLLRGTAERRVDGAVALLQSLSERARAVFRELADRQKGAEKGGLHMRTTFNEFFEMVKQKFLVSDQATLRTILTELSTHDLLQTRRGVDSAERLWIPLDETQLEEILGKIAPAE